MKEFEITKREIIMSIAIAAIMIVFGILIFGKISESNMDSDEIYNKALRVNDKATFKYGMKTNIGNAFIYGELSAIDTVTYPEIGGKYLNVEKTEQEYTMHTREVSSTDSKGNVTYHTETYWTWDDINSEEKQCSKVMFYGSKFNSSQFSIPSRDYITTIDGGYNLRYEYYGYPQKSVGTIFTSLLDGNINKIDIPFYKDMDIKQTVDYLESDADLVIFCIVWFLVICGTIYGFYYLDNKWLDN